MKKMYLILVAFIPWVLFSQSDGNSVRSNENNKVHSNQTQYKITEFFSYDGKSSTARANNNFGTVVGLTSFSGFNSAIMVKNGEVTYLDPNEDGFDSRLINDSDQVAGTSHHNQKYFQATLWENGILTNLEPGVEDYSWASAINNAGQVVGFRGLGSSREAILWQNGTSILLMNGNYISANGINDQGQIVISNNDDWAITTTSYLWQNSSYTQLPGIDFNAQDINNIGQIAGSSRISQGGQFQACVYLNGVITHLGTLGEESGAVAINDSGVVVGHSRVSGEERPFLWESGVMIDLNTLLEPNSGWLLTLVRGINNSGQIVGDGFFNGLPRGFILEPQSVPTNLNYNRFIHMLSWSKPNQQVENYVVASKEKFNPAALWKLVDPDSGGVLLPNDSTWTVRTSGYNYYKVGAVYAAGDTLYSDSVDVPRGYYLRRIINGEVSAYNIFAFNFRLIPNQAQYMWPSAWYLRPFFNYQDPNLFNQAYFDDASSNYFPDWYLASEIDGYSKSYISYPDNVRGGFVQLWEHYGKRLWNGSCFGFTAAANFSFYRFEPFRNRFTFFNGQIPGDVSITNNDSFSDSLRKMINYLQSTQSFGNHFFGHSTNNPKANEVLSVLQNEFANYGVNFHKFIYLLNKKNYNHAVLPYAIEKVNENLSYIYIYDSNAPSNDNRRIEVNTLNNTWRLPGYINNFVNYSIDVRSGLENLFQGSGARPSADQLENFKVAISGTNSSYVIFNGDTLTGFNSADTSYLTMENVIAYPTDGILRAPEGYLLDPENYRIIFKADINEGGNPGLYLQNEINGYAGFLRAGTINLNETDEVTIGYNRVTYVNPDAAPRNVIMYQSIDNFETSGSKYVKYFEVENMSVTPFDSVSISKTNDENINLISYGGISPLDILFTYSDSTKSGIFRNSGLTFPPNSAFTLLPVWEDLQNSALTVLVDNGIDGSIDDTLQIFNTVGVEDEGNLLTPTEYNLAQNYPNPFNPTTTIQFSIPQRSNVVLKVYDVLGTEVKTLVNEEKEQGVYTINFDASQLASGIYLYKLQAGSFVETKKMLMLK